MDPIQPGTPQAETKKNIGPIIGVIVIIILLIIAALYMWGERLTGSNTATDAPINTISTETIPAGSNTNVGAADEPLSPSDEIDVLETELSETGTIEIDLSGLE